jgi:hypothetical protein
MKPRASRWWGRARRMVSEHLIAIAFGFCATGVRYASAGTRSEREVETAR